MRRFAELFWSFFKIGLFTFGGGYAMISIIEDEIIRRKQWIEHKEFLDLLALAQSAPGPIALNTSVFVGYKMYGYRGAVSALLGVSLPSFVIILTIAIFFAQFRYNPVVDAAFRGMRPAVVALIIAPILGFVKGMQWYMLAAAGVVAMLIWHLGISPIYILFTAAILGILFAARRGKEVAQ